MTSSRPARHELPPLAVTAGCTPGRTPARAEPFFAGPVCVLTGSYTFSAASELAEAVKTYGLATIVGEETGGQPDPFGNALPFMLPRSRLPVNIATATSIRANGNVTDFSSVNPDIVVRTTADDIRRGFDPVIARAANCPPTIDPLTWCAIRHA
ncbi:MAG TPA: S41 family peptidase [Vicinamibacterales bacterium]|nr:S41 family peptidase [Vicinamibacterales bacterium]